MKNYFFFNRKFVIFLIPIIFIIGGTFVAILTISENSSESNKFDDGIERDYKEITEILQSEIDQYILALRVLGQVFEAVNITAEQFKIITDVAAVPVQQLEWVPEISHSERHDLERQISESYNRNVSIIEFTDNGLQISSEKNIYYPVTYINPLEGNEAALLLDIGSNPVRRNDLERSKSTSPEKSKIVTSKKITLVQGGFAMIIFNPVHRGNNFLGFSAGVYRIKDFFEFLLQGIKNSRINLHLFFDQEYIVSLNFIDGRYKANFSNRENSHSGNNVLFFGDDLWQIYHTPNIEKPLESVFTIGLSSTIILCVLTALIVSIIEIYRRQTRGQNKDEQNAITRKFISYIFHEIRVPMNTLTLGIKNLSNGKLSKNKKHILEMMKVSVEQMTHVLNDILDLRKMESGKFTIDKSEFSLYEMIDICHKSFLPVAQDKNLEFIVNFPENLKNKNVFADRYRLMQCINNLLSNAIKYTENGKVTIDVTYSMKKLNISVTDTGRGISMENIAKLFIPYTQINSGHSTEIGTGLGLTISRNIAELHNGTITVESVENVGSTFTLSVESPITEILYQLKRADTENDLSFGAILIVDDNKDNCVLLQEYLSTVLILNETVNYVLNGVECLREIENKGLLHYQLIILDKHMPLMDGITTAEKLREMGFTGIIIGLTGLADEAEKDKFLYSGVNELMIKPIEFRKFKEYISKYSKKKSDQ